MNGVDAETSSKSIAIVFVQPQLAVKREHLEIDWQKESEEGVRRLGGEGEKDVLYQVRNGVGVAPCPSTKSADANSRGGNAPHISCEPVQGLHCP